jgi:hypothetical protein
MMAAAKNPDQVEAKGPVMRHLNAVGNWAVKQVQTVSAAEKSASAKKAAATRKRNVEQHGSA